MNKLKTPIGRWQEAIQVPCTNKSKIGTNQAKTTVPIRPNEIALRETPASLTDILVSTSKLAIPTHPTSFFACSKDFKRLTMQQILRLTDAKGLQRNSAMTLSILLFPSQSLTDCTDQGEIVPSFKATSVVRYVMWTCFGVKRKEGGKFAVGSDY
jgi:hypothetical protein